MNPFAIIIVALVPCGVAAATMFVCRRLGLVPHTAWVTSVGAALVIGQMALTAPAGATSAIGRLFQPHEAIDWLPWLVLLAVGISIVSEYVPHLTGWRPIALVLIFSAAATARLLAGSVHVTSRFSSLEKFGVLVLWSSVFTLLWRLFDAGRASGQPLLRGGLLIITTLGLAAAVALPSTFVYGGIYLVIAGTIAGALLGCIAMRSAADFLSALDPSGAAAPLATILGGILLLCRYYGGLSLLDTLLAAVALAAAVGPMPKSWPTPPLARAALRTASCLIPLAIAVALAIAAATADPYAG